MNKKSVSKIALFEIQLLIFSVVAFSFILNSAFVSGQDEPQDEPYGPPTEMLGEPYGPPTEMLGGRPIEEVESSPAIQQLPLPKSGGLPVGEVPPEEVIPKFVKKHVGEEVTISMDGVERKGEVQFLEGKSGIVSNNKFFPASEKVIRKGLERRGEEILRNFAGKEVIYGDKKGILIETAEGHALKTEEGLIKITDKSLLKTPAEAGGGVGKVSTIFGRLPFAIGHIVQGLFWAVAAVGAIQVIGYMAGLEPELTRALSVSAFSGIMAGKTLYSAFGPGGFIKAGVLTTPLAAGIGVAIGMIVFALAYKKESKKIVTFTCEPWEAPIGGEYCEKCNGNEFKPCSEYRCKSLGQACELLNVGTGNESCVWKNPSDVTSPTIDAWYDELSEGHSYKDVQSRPPGVGMSIVRDVGDGCIKAFTPLEFGIVTNEPAQCKIDYNHTAEFEDMQFWFGETNLYLYNHSQRLSLPGPAALNAQAPELKNDGIYTLYTRCRDANGNYNIDEFAIRFCVEKGPDTTPPRIEGTSIVNGMPIAFNTTSVELEVYLNEPADCRWSRLDRSYENMENEMQCTENVWEMNAQLLYKCITTLTGLKDRTENIYYFRCKDQPWLTGEDEKDRNENTESYKFMLKGTQPLNIVDVKPNGTIRGASDYVTIWLELETADGYDLGDATCYYSTSGEDKDYIQFFDTGTNIHKQRQDLPKGEYTYYFKCVDLGGNADYNQTTFTVFIDRQGPIITRLYDEGGILRVITNEKSTCSYSMQDCNFDIDEGIDMHYPETREHYIEWQLGQVYYMRCRDESGNEPSPRECTAIVRGWS